MPFPGFCCKNLHTVLYVAMLRKTRKKWPETRKAVVNPMNGRRDHAHRPGHAITNCFWFAALRNTYSKMIRGGVRTVQGVRSRRCFNITTRRSLLSDNHEWLVVSRPSTIRLGTYVRRTTSLWRSSEPPPVHHDGFRGDTVVLCGKYNQSSVFPVELCGFVPHNIIPKEWCLLVASGGL
jgi:hypothetical protein